MGYGFTSTDSQFVIKKENFENVLIQLKKLKGLMWVGSVENCETLNAAFNNLGWKIILDDFEDVCKIKFIGHVLGDELRFFETIAKYVVDHSFIECCGEDGDLWRYVFFGDECMEVYPTIQWIY